MANYCFLVALGLLLSLQHFPASPALHNSTGYTTSTGGIHTQSHAAGMHFSAPSPFQSALAAIDMELEVVEEDDNPGSQHELYGSLPRRYAADERKYTGFLRSRYLQLLSSAHDQPLVPFFVLYHSWKEHLRASYFLPGKCLYTGHSV